MPVHSTLRREDTHYPPYTEGVPGYMKAMDDDPVRDTQYREAIQQAIKHKLAQGYTTVRVFEVGIGHQKWMQYIVETQPKVHYIGIECNETLLEKAEEWLEEWRKANRGDKHPHYLVKSLPPFLHCPIENGTVDILLSELLGSTTTSESAAHYLKPFMKCLKPDGIVIPCETKQYLTSVCNVDLANQHQIPHTGVLYFKELDRKGVKRCAVSQRKLIRLEEFSPSGVGVKEPRATFHIRPPVDGDIRPSIDSNTPPQVDGFLLEWEALLYKGEAPHTEDIVLYHTKTQLPDRTHCQHWPFLYALCVPDDIPKFKFNSEKLVCQIFKIDKGRPVVTIDAEQVEREKNQPATEKATEVHILQPRKKQKTTPVV